jgi:energy-coupling factor transporter ATP-binding protein EcfA2
MQDLQLKKTLTALIFGQVGSGKTTLALSSDPNCLLIDTDNGVNRVHEDHLSTAGFIQVKTFEDIQDGIRSPEAKEFSTIVIDTAGKLMELLMDYTRRTTTKNPPVGISLRNYAFLNNNFKNFVAEVRQMDKNLIFVAHQSTVKNGDDIRFEPDLRAQSYAFIATELDLIGYLECIGKQRTLCFNPTDRHDGKNTGGFTDILHIPELRLGQPNNFFAENVVKKHFENVAAKEARQREIAKELKDIDAMLATVSDAISANEVIANMKTRPQIGTNTMYAWTKLKEKAGELGLDFDKETKLYKVANATVEVSDGANSSCPTALAAVSPNSSDSSNTNRVQNPVSVNQQLPKEMAEQVRHDGADGKAATDIFDNETEGRK